MSESTESMMEIISGMKRFLSLRERCRSEAEIYLKKKGVSGEEIRRAVSYLMEEGMIDESRFAKNRIQSRIRKGYGPQYIQNELRQLRLPDAVISEQMEELDEDEFLEHACEYIERKLPSLISDEKSMEKLYSGLRYRGFYDSQIRASLEMAKKSFPHWGRQQKGFRED